MLEAGGDQRLAPEPRGVLGVGVEQLLERHRPPEDAIVGGDDAGPMPPRATSLETYWAGSVSGRSSMAIVASARGSPPRRSCPGTTRRPASAGPVGGPPSTLGTGGRWLVTGAIVGANAWIAGRRIAGAHLLAM
ncbi:MAG: hypothetical protein IPL61_18670 [Myxococcales bacterium]|nr:hypothetical protein [Myxococcales bacterium]